MLLLVGCVRSTDFSNEEALEYLKQRYGSNFELVSVEKVASDQRKYLDERMGAIPTESSLSNEPKEEEEEEVDDFSIIYDTIYTFRDENGLVSHISRINYPSYPFGYHRNYEDYSAQYLISHPHLYDKLTSSRFTCEYVNTIGDGESLFTGFILTIQSFEEISEAVKLVYETISQQSELLPDKKYNIEFKDKFDSVYPIVCIRLSGYDINLAEIPFLTENITEIEKDINYYIRLAEFIFVRDVRDGDISYNLPDEILEKIPNNEIVDITYKDEIMLDMLEYSFGSDCYYFTEYRKETDEDGYDIIFNQLTRLLEKVGYKTEYSNNTVSWSKDNNIIKIVIKNNEYSCTKNGKVYKFKGKLNSRIEIMEDDFKSLFGITFHINQINRTGKIIVSE